MGFSVVTLDNCKVLKELIKGGRVLEIMCGLGAYSYDAETNTGGVHWWTFLGAYNNLGDCTFAQVVRIRDKKARGKTLEKDEREWYRRNSDLVNIKNKLSQEEETTISTWLKLGKE